MAHDLASLLFGETRRQALARLLLHPEVSLHVREIARHTGKAPGTMLRELNQLADAGILLRGRIGNQVHFQANRACPIHEELRAIVKKTSGIADVLREALAPLAGRIRVAFIHGSIARGTERAASDIDLMIVGDVRFEEVVGVLQRPQQELRREVNPGLYREAEFRKRLAVGDPYLRRVMEGEKIVVVGGPDELGELASHRPARGARRGAGRD